MDVECNLYKYIMHNVGYFHLVSIILIYLSRVVDTQTGPTHCSYSDGVYTCNYDKMTSTSYRPIPFSDFTTQPQQLILNVNGLLPYFGNTSILCCKISNFSGLRLINLYIIFILI